jgi:hypothetical protein
MMHIANSDVEDIVPGSYILIITLLPEGEMMYL